MAVLEIRFDSSGLSKIYAAGQSVTLTRTVGQVVETMALSSAVATGSAGAAAAGVTVAWQAFSPLATNTVEWGGGYVGYATTTPLAIGNVVTINAESAAAMQTQSVYAFTQGQFVQRPLPGSPSYVVGNGTPAGTYAFGMLQTATINNAQMPGPLCAVPVLYNEAAYLDPGDVVAIFLSSATKAGTVIPSPVDPFSVDLGGNGGAVPVIGFDDQTNTFYQIS